VLRVARTNWTGGAPTVLALAVLDVVDRTSAMATTMANEILMGPLLKRVARKA
jgi:hypothetical protein